jgi:hypothetical protein
MRRVITRKVVMLPALVVDGMNSVPAFTDENSDT